MKFVTRVYDALVQLGFLLAATLIPFIMLGVSLDVGGRYLFGAPLSWMFEASEHALLCIPFLSMAWLARYRDGHVLVETGIEMLPPQRRPLLRAFGAWLAALACLAAAWFSTMAAADNFDRGVVTAGIHPVPKWPFLALIAFGLALAAVQFLRRGWLEAAGRPLPDPDDWAPGAGG